MKAVQSLMHIPLATNDYNTLDKVLQLSPETFVPMVMGAYADWFSRFVNAYSSYPAIMVKGITGILLLISAAAIILGLCRRSMPFPEKLLYAVLIGLLPLGMNLVYVLTIGYTHDLMVYPIWLTYLMMLLLADWLAGHIQLQAPFLGKIKTGPLLNGVCMVLVFLLMYGNVQFSNGMYLKKDLEYDAYLSLMTRVVDRMETYDGYLPGETPVYFAGLPDNLNEIIPGFKEYRNVTGMLSTDVLYVPQKDHFQAYFDYILGTPINLTDDAVWAKMRQNPIVAQMPSFPDKNCIAYIDDIMVVKLGK